MKLCSECLQSLYDSFPLLREILVEKSLKSPEFYALAALRPAHVSDIVSERLSWISDSVVFVPSSEITISEEVADRRIDKQNP